MRQRAPVRYDDDDYVQKVGPMLTKKEKDTSWDEDDNSAEDVSF